MKASELIAVLAEYPDNAEIKILVDERDLQDCKEHGDYDAGDPSNNISCMYAFDLPSNEHYYDDKEKVIAFDVWSKKA